MATCTYTKHLYSIGSNHEENKPQENGIWYKRVKVKPSFDYAL